MEANAFDLTKRLEDALNHGRADEALDHIRKLREIGVSLTFDFTEGKSEERKQEEKVKSRGEFTPDSAKNLKVLLINKGLSAAMALKISRGVSSWEEFDKILESY
mmetsp:Transcript_9339/g.17922  ORF Transcript_9339/g.17922 Transcript_9339/m.17922 type:complete len:105 (-) Transcript_9339:493-807(-)